MLRIRLLTDPAASLGRQRAFLPAGYGDSAHPYGPSRRWYRIVGASARGSQPAGEPNLAPARQL